MPQKITLEVSPYDTILKLKRLVEQHGCQYPQNLIFDGRYLQDEDTVGGSEINPGARLFVTETRNTIPSVSKPISTLVENETKLCPSTSELTNTVSLDVTSASTMADVREGVRRFIGSLPEKYRVVHNGNVVSNSFDTFEEMGIKDGSSLYFVVEK
jgi:hypothetical protein